MIGDCLPKGRDGLSRHARLHQPLVVGVALWLVLGDVEGLGKVVFEVELEGLVARLGTSKGLGERQAFKRREVNPASNGTLFLNRSGAHHALRHTLRRPLAVRQLSAVHPFNLCRNSREAHVTRHSSASVAFNNVRDASMAHSHLDGGRVPAVLLYALNKAVVLGVSGHALFAAGTLNIRKHGGWKLNRGLIPASNRSGDALALKSVVWPLLHVLLGAALFCLKPANIPALGGWVVKGERAVNERSHIRRSAATSGILAGPYSHAFIDGCVFFGISLKDVFNGVSNLWPHCGPWLGCRWGFGDWLANGHARRKIV